MNVSRVTEALESIAPLARAEPWDNVGLVLGRREWPAERIMLTIDLTSEVLEEAIEQDTRMIVAYHPPIFEPLTAITEATAKQRIVLDAVGAGIAVYSPHTALDAAPGGVNDWLAEGLGAGDVRALVPQATRPASEENKVVTFCPPDAVDDIRKGLAAIGAGRIGAYELCSFEIQGTGTFRGGPGTRPAVGDAGRLERVAEVRLEMVCPDAALALAVLTIRQCHPYEEPPIEIYTLHGRPDRGIGAGRRVVLDQAATLEELLARIKQRLGVEELRVAVGRDAPARYGSIGLGAGAGGSLLEIALGEGCRLFLTGEMRHHDVLAARERGCTVVLAGHTNTERGYLPHLAAVLRDRLPDVSVTIAQKDRDPLARR